MITGFSKSFPNTLVANRHCLMVETQKVISYTGPKASKKQAPPTGVYSFKGKAWGPSHLTGRINLGEKGKIRGRENWAQEPCQGNLS